VTHEAELRRREAVAMKTGRNPVGRPPKQRKPTKNSLIANPTDPDSRVMKTKYTYLQGYNAQAVVSEDQVIVAAAITQEPADMHQLHPMLERGGANFTLRTSKEGSAGFSPTPATTARPTLRPPRALSSDSW
jgi:hypothetical protein